MRALILGGGGITGIAWELGLLAGLRRQGAGLDGADVIVGTSAGSYVGALLATGADLDQAVARAADIDVELSPRIDPALLAQGFAVLSDSALAPVEKRRLLGQLAVRAPLGDDTPHVTRFAETLPEHRWPEHPR